MVKVDVRQQILDDLDGMSPEMQDQAARLVHELVKARPRGVPGRDLLRFAGTIDPESLREMEAAIGEGCERVDSDEW